jgi:outer membrane protein assembly factor BamD
MKRIILLFSTTLPILVLSSCAAQQHTENAVSMYQEAMSKYEKKDYYDARRLFQEAIPLLKGKKEIIPAQFYLAQCYFYDKKYRESAYYFAEFYKTYPRVQQTEEALYMQGYSMYLDSPDIRVDATKTEKALHILKQYIHQFPRGTYQPEAQQCIQKLKDKLALKAFRNAKLYYHLGHYQASVIAVNNFQEAYPDAVYGEEAIYIKAKAQGKLAAAAAAAEDQLNSWKVVIQYYYELLDQYPDSKYAQEVQAIYEQALQKVDQLASYQTIKNN